MLLGEPIIYGCPNCEKEVAVQSFLSGNTFGGILFTDGKVDAPMMPETNMVAKCENCGVIFWLVEKNELGTQKLMNFLEKNIAFVKAANKELYQEAITKGIYENSKQERFLRIHYWWKANDEIRYNEMNNEQILEEDFYKENAERILLLLDEKKIEDLIMKSELYRNLGKFEQAKKEIDKASKKVNYPVITFIQELINANERTVKIVEN